MSSRTEVYQREEYEKVLINFAKKYPRLAIELREVGRNDELEDTMQEVITKAVDNCMDIINADAEDNYEVPKDTPF